MGDRIALALDVARHAAGRMRPGGTLLLMGSAAAGRVRPGLGISSAAFSALPPVRGRPRAGTRAGPRQPRRGRARRPHHDQHRAHRASYDIDGGQQYVS
jgi:hypothetical protein